MLAANGGHYTVVEMLLHAAADPHVRAKVCKKWLTVA